MRTDEIEISGEARRVADGRVRRALHLLLVGLTDSAAIQAFRYVFVGAVATVADMATLGVLTEVFHIYPLISAAFAFIVGLAVNYAMSIRWVFASRRLGSATAEFTVFAIIGVAGLGLTELIMGVGMHVIHLHYMVAKVAAVVIVFIWNFGARRTLLFRKKESNAG
ncbi:MAG TPA: GtrA family protein [Armatimonadota bacterium]|nr:GtrA family protein [Armatimonadota bacterium]